MRRLAAVVLAAGRGERFGGAKQLALLEGRPLLAHVLEAVASVRPSFADLVDVVVVVGFHAEEVERAVAVAVAASAGSAGLRVVRNPDPSRGLSSSLRTGLASLGPDIDGALIVLGDQPRVRPDVIEAIADAWAAGAAVAVVPRYAAGGGHNPALLDRRAWHLASGLTGDRGMASIMTGDPTLALVVDVAGSNPDVDTPADLAAL
jgi:molybdenum cofactor cytidylyltransferase